MRKGYNWRAYDYEFRSTQQAEETPWDVIRTDLYHLHAVPLAPSGNKFDNRQKFRPESGTTSVPLGFCNLFHTAERKCYFGTACTYSHKCHVNNCGQNHPGYLHHDRTRQQQEVKVESTHRQRAPRGSGSSRGHPRAYKGRDANPGPSRQAE